MDEDSGAGYAAADAAGAAAASIPVETAVGAVACVGAGAGSGSGEAPNPDDRRLRPLSSFPFLASNDLKPEATNAFDRGLWGDQISASPPDRSLVVSAETATTGDVKIPCPDCSQTFLRKSALSSHRKHRHSRVAPETLAAADARAMPEESDGSVNVEEEKAALAGVTQLDDDGHHSMCALCGDGGNLLLCDACPRTFHAECLVTLKDAPPRSDEEEWKCPPCRSVPLPADAAIVSAEKILAWDIAATKCKLTASSPSYTVFFGTAGAGAGKGADAGAGTDVDVSAGVGVAISAPPAIPTASLRKRGYPPFICEAKGCGFAASKISEFLVHLRSHQNIKEPAVPDGLDHEDSVEEFVGRERGSHTVVNRKTDAAARPDSPSADRSNAAKKFVCGEDGCDFESLWLKSVERHKMRKHKELRYALDEAHKHSRCAICEGSQAMLFLCDSKFCPFVFCTPCLKSGFNEDAPPEDDSAWTCPGCRGKRFPANSAYLTYERKQTALLVASPVASSGGMRLSDGASTRAGAGVGAGAGAVGGAGAGKGGGAGAGVASASVGVAAEAGKKSAPKGAESAKSKAALDAAEEKRRRSEEVEEARLEAVKRQRTSAKASAPPAAAKISASKTSAAAGSDRGTASRALARGTLEATHGADNDESVSYDKDLTCGNCDRRFLSKAGQMSHMRFCVSPAHAPERAVKDGKGEEGAAARGEPESSSLNAASAVDREQYSFALEQLNELLRSKVITFDQWLVGSQTLSKR